MDMARRTETVITLYSHNLLASTWVKLGCDSNPPFYKQSLVDKGLLDSVARYKLSLTRAVESNANVICFQEVGLSEAVAVWSSELAKLYHITGFVDNSVTSASEANGVLVLLRRGVMDPNYQHTGVQLNGTTGASIVSCRMLKSSEPNLLVISCHLDWGNEGTLQGRHLMKVIEAESKAMNAAAVVWCGDFNKRPQDPFFSEVRAQGYQDAFAFTEELYTCGCGRQPSRLDYVLYRGVTPAHTVLCPSDFSGSTLSEASLMGKFRDLEQLLGNVGSDHVPLAVALFISNIEEHKILPCPQRDKSDRIDASEIINIGPS